MSKFDDDDSDLQIADFDVLGDSPGDRRKLWCFLFSRGRQLLYGVLIYGEGYKSLASHDSPVTLLIDSRPIVLPKPDGMLYVVGPSRRLHGTPVRAEAIEKYLNDEIMGEFFMTAEWADKLLPVLTANEWIEPEKWTERYKWQ